jgi:hypothetical protein
MLPRASFFQLELEAAALQLGELFFFIAAGVQFGMIVSRLRSVWLSLLLEKKKASGLV